MRAVVRAADLEKRVYARWPFLPSDRQSDWSQIIELLWGNEEKLCVFSIPTANFPHILWGKSVRFDVKNLTTSDQARLPAKWEKEERLMMLYGFFQACARSLKVRTLKNEWYFCRNERIIG